MRVRTDDGWNLALEPFEAAGDPRAAVLLGPAMMANRRSLDRPSGRGLASTLAEGGLAVYTLDPRGHGDSLPRASRAVDWSYDDVVRLDLPAALRTVRARHPGLPVALVGHSLCGHGGAAALGLSDEKLADALVMIASNVWVPRLEPSRTRWLAKRAILELWCAVTRRVGFFPTRALRAGSDDEARSYVLQFDRWARSDRWTDESGAVDYLAAVARLEVPTLSVLSRGDRLLCRPEAGRRFCSHFAARPPEVWEVDGAELGLPRGPGHMELVTDARCRPLWERLAHWIVEATDRALSPS
ncbi:MAG: alpha/beta hydrolase [Deltaproteobacteria bacterium]|nr:alpha/beta hydrolase [Deltaproteobacteria bacterium]